MILDSFEIIFISIIILKYEQIEMHKDIISILYHVCIFDVRHKHNDQLKLKCTNSLSTFDTKSWQMKTTLNLIQLFDYAH